MWKVKLILLPTQTIIVHMKRANHCYPECFANVHASFQISELSKQQLSIFEDSIVFGVKLGLYYQIIWVLREMIHHNQLAIFIEDLVFFSWVTLKAIGFFAQTTKGAVYWFSFMGILIGTIFVEKTKHKIVQVFHKISTKKG